MLIDLIDLTTADNVALNAAYWPAEPVRRPSRAVDAWLLLPGASGAFYSQIQRPFAQALTRYGYPALTLSTRGHDLAWNNRSDGRLFGVAAEILSESHFDIGAALDELTRRGADRIGLLGHSMGCIKTFHFLATRGDPRVTAYAAVSGTRIGRTRWQAGPHAARTADLIAESERLVAAGEGDVLRLYPTPQGRSYQTPRAFLDRNTDDRYDIVALAPKIAVPMIFLRGSNEPDIVPDGLMEHVLALAVNARPSRAVTIEGADHFYLNGTHQGAIDAIVDWLKELNETCHH